MERRRRRIATLCIIHTFACSMHVPRASVSTNLSPVEIALSLGAASFPPFPIQANFRFTYLARISKKKKRKRSKKEKRRGFNLRSTIGYLLLSAHSSVKCKSPLVRGWPRICIWRKVVAGNSSLLPHWFRRLSPYIYIQSVSVDLYTRRRSEKIRSLFIFLSAGYRGWTIGSSFYEPNPFWDKQNVLILIVFFFILSRKREREIGLTFASFIKWFHAYSTYCRRGKAVPSFLILFVIPADDHGWFSPVF